MSVTIHTSLGFLKVELFCDTVPKLTYNFLALLASGYYNGTRFHRNMAGFMIQGGDPSGKGKGGESAQGGFLEDEFSSEHSHNKRGIVSMANNGENQNGSQFFITYSKQEHLDEQYCIIGHVIDGFTTLDKMEKVPVGKKNRPTEDIVIQSVHIHANPLAHEADDDDEGEGEDLGNMKEEAQGVAGKRGKGSDDESQPKKKKKVKNEKDV